MSEDQLTKEKNARYIMAIGLMFSDDFFANAMTPEDLARVDMTGAYVIKVQKPACGMFIFFGAGFACIPDLPYAPYNWVCRTETEALAMGNFMAQVDREGLYRLRCTLYHIDMKEAEASIVKRPTDVEIAQMHIRAHSGDINNTAKIKRQLRALDRRRYRAGIMPPPDRMDNLKFIKELPRRFRAKGPIDPYKSASDDEDARADDSKILDLQRELFGSDSSSSSDCDRETTRVQSATGRKRRKRPARELKSKRVQSPPGSP